MIAVMGAAGNTGRIVADRLLDLGEKVRVLGRDPQHLQALAARGAEVVTGDAADASLLERAFAGAEAAYTLVPPNVQAPDFRAYQDQLGESTARALGSAGVRRVVFLSSIGAEQPAGTGPIAGLHAQEQRLKALRDVDVLLLRPGYFFENHLATLGLIKHQGINAGALAGGTAIAMTATRDIGEAAARALHARDFHGATVRDLMGPRDLSLDETTRILGAKIGRPDLKYVQFPYPVFEEALVQMGLSRSMAGQYAEMAQALNEGRVRPTQGRSPQTSTPTRFEDFADVLAAAYARL